MVQKQAYAVPFEKGFVECDIGLGEAGIGMITLIGEPVE